jgi:hypothetical protein
LNIMTYVAQQSVTKIISLIFVNWSHLKLELCMSFCSTNWPLYFQWDQIYCYDFGQTLLLKPDLDVKKIVAGLLNKSSSFKCDQFTNMLLVTVCCATSVRLRCSTNRGRFVEQMLIRSSSLTCDQIHYNHRYDLGHTLLCYLSWT